MTFDEAKEILLLHSYAHPDTNHPTKTSGFLGSLRPFTGLNKANFEEVMTAIITIAPHLQQSATLDRDVVSALWSICTLARDWGIDPKGMLRRNNIITSEDVERLEDWVASISYAVFILLDGGDLDSALTHYKALP